MPQNTRGPSPQYQYNEIEIDNEEDLEFSEVYKEANYEDNDYTYEGEYENDRTVLVDNEEGVVRTIHTLLDEPAHTDKDKIQQAVDKVSNLFKQRFDLLMEQRDKEYLELQSKYEKVVEDLNNLNSDVSPLEYMELKKSYQKTIQQLELLQHQHQELLHREGKTTKYERKDKSQIRVTVKEAQDFAINDSEDLCVKVTLGEQTFYTTYRNIGSLIVWEESFFFPDAPGRGKRLEVSVHDKNKLHIATENLGVASLELPVILSSLDLWIPVSRKGQPGGRIHLVIETEEHLRQKEQEIIQTNVDQINERIINATREELHFQHMSTISDYVPPGTEWKLSDMNGEKFWVCLVVKDGKFVLDPTSKDKSMTLGPDITTAVFKSWGGKFQSLLRQRTINKIDAEYGMEIDKVIQLHSSSLNERELLKRKEEEIRSLKAKTEEAQVRADDMRGKLVLSSSIIREKNDEISKLKTQLEHEQYELSNSKKRVTQVEKMMHISEDEVRQTRRELMAYKSWSAKTEGALVKLEQQSRASPTSPLSHTSSGAMTPVLMGPMSPPGYQLNSTPQTITNEYYLQQQQQHQQQQQQQQHQHNTSTSTGPATDPKKRTNSPTRRGESHEVRLINIKNRQLAKREQEIVKLKRFIESQGDAIRQLKQEQKQFNIDRQKLTNEIEHLEKIINRNNAAIALEAK